MPCAVHNTSAVTATAKRYHPNPPPDLIIEEPAPKCSWSAPEDPERESQPRCHKTQTELAHANRVAMLGQLSASIAHEIKQPIGAVVVNAQAALRLLNVQPTNMEAVRWVLACIVNDGMRAGEIVDRTCALIKKAPPRRQSLEINATILEAIDMTRGELVMNGVSVQTKLAKDLPLVQGDRVQLQQVMLNLIINAIEAMSLTAAGSRDLLIRTAKTRSGGVLVAVRDYGPGVDPADLERIFDTFFSTKAKGLGMGLSICRAIVEAHGGKLWATRGVPHGTILQFTSGSGGAS
jgi:C4-dicarboxylate-specific signal transduction histidine kinase